MCRFKSGIILKNKNVIAQVADNSHSRLLEELEIEDTIENAMRVFVRAELIPPDDEWWTDVDTWMFKVDQDIIPDWFENDRDRYEQSFREDVKDWCNEHILIDKKIDELNNGYYMLKRCEIKRLCKEVSVMCDSSTVQEMCDSSIVQEMCNSSTVQEMWGSSTVQKMWDSSIVQKMRDSSTVQEMCDSSTVQEMCDSSTVQIMWDSSTVQEMCDSSTVQIMCNSSTVQKMWDSSVARSSRTDKIYVGKEFMDKIEIFESEETE